MEYFLVLSNGWLDRFKAQHFLKEYQFHEEAGSVSALSISAACARIQNITLRYSQWDIYNMDKTGLYYWMPPDCSLTTRQMSGIKGDKMRILIAFVMNADGSDIWRPLFIEHSQRTCCFIQKEVSDFSFIYFWNKKVWMTGSIFQRQVLALICLLTPMLSE